MKATLNLPDAPISTKEQIYCMGVVGISLIPLLHRMPAPLAFVLALMGTVFGLYTIQKSPSKWMKITLGFLFIIFSIIAAGATARADVRMAVAVSAAAFISTYSKTRHHGIMILGVAVLVIFVGLSTRPNFFDMALGVLTIILSITQMFRLTSHYDGFEPTAKEIFREIGSIVWLSIPFSIMAVLAAPYVSRATINYMMGSHFSWSPTIAGSSMTPGDLDEALINPETAFRVKFQGEAPPPIDRYWRNTVLWDFNGITWSRPQWADEHEAPDDLMIPLPNQEHWDYTITPITVGVKALLDGTALSPKPSGAGWSRDRVLSKALSILPSKWTWHATPSVEKNGYLTKEEREAALALPEGYNPRTIKLAQAWRERNPEDEKFITYTLAMFKMLFHYTTEAPGLDGVNRIDDLFFKSPRGYCQHFSSAFAVIMRAGGIPSRIVTGYYGGKENEWGGYWRVQESDAHAWVEIWQEHVGWVRIDPTSVVNGWTAAPPAWRAWMSNDFFDWVSERWQASMKTITQWAEQTSIARLSWEKWIFGIIPILLVLVILLSRKLWIAGYRKQKKEYRQSQVAWKQLEKTLIKQGKTWARKPHEGAVSYVQRIGSNFSADEANKLVEIAHQWNAWHYGGNENVNIKQWREQMKSLIIELKKR